MKESILSVVERLSLRVGTGFAPLGAGRVRAMTIANEHRMLMIALDGYLEDISALRAAAAELAGLEQSAVWVYCEGKEALDERAAMAAAQEAVAAALRSGRIVTMATFRDRTFGPETAEDREITLLRFDAGEEPAALLVSLPQACDHARLAKELEALMPGRLAMIMPAACCEGELETDGLAGIVCGLAERAVNPVCTPPVNLGTIRQEDRTVGSIVYIGRTILWAFEARMPAKQVLALRAAFPNDRQLPSAWNAFAPCAQKPERLAADTCARMKTFVPIGWGLPQPFIDAVEHKYFDVHYDVQSKDQVMDIWLPDDGDHAPHPVIVYCHGGAFSHGWQRGNDVIPMLGGLDRGYAVVSLQYRLSGEARFPAALYDAKAALRYLRAHAEEYGLNMERVYVWGGSAGSWLVSMTALTAGVHGFEDLTHGVCGPLAPKPRAVISWCGPSDHAVRSAKEMTPEDLARDAQEPFSRFLGSPTALVPELCRMASPISHVTADAPPFLFLHGTGDELVPVEQSEKMYAALQAARRADDELHIEEGRPHHGDSWMHEPRIIKMCLDFIDRH